MAPRTDRHDARHDQSFFGRETELMRVMKNLSEGRHTLITGSYGIGKTSLMREARLLLTGVRHRVDLRVPFPTVNRERMLLVSTPAPPGDCLKEIAGGLYRAGVLDVPSTGERSDWSVLKKEFARLGNRGMQSEILSAMAGSGIRYVLFVKNLERIPLPALPFFESLLRLSVMCGGAIETKDVEAFRGFWSSFERIHLEPLPAPEAEALVSHLMMRYPLNVVDPAMCRKEILTSADGNPFNIKNLMYRAATQGTLGRREIRAFRAAEEGSFFNMGPMYMIGAGVLTAVKFFSVGAEKREHYIYYSAIGFMLYLLFRVFRSFFVFRPARRR